MIRGLYSAASALQVASEQQEVIAYNLANSSMPGYRARGLVFESFDQVLGRASSPTGDIVGARTLQSYIDFRPGSFQYTGDPYNLALGETDHFFVLNGPSGPLYTRNGSFFRGNNGQIVSQAGYTLQAEDGPVTIPPETVDFHVASDGSLTADGQPAGRLRQVRFADMSKLVASGPTLFTAPQNAGLQNTVGRVMQGHREGSNIEPAESMVRMILGSRYYDAAQRSLRAMSEALQLDTRPTQS